MRMMFRLALCSGVSGCWLTPAEIERVKGAIPLVDDTSPGETAHTGEPFAGPDLTCVTEDLGSRVGTALWSGDLSLLTDDFESMCSEPGSTGKDVELLWTPTVDGCAVFTVREPDGGVAVDSVLSIWSACDGEELVCNDDFDYPLESTADDPDRDKRWSQIQMEVSAQVPVVVVADGWTAEDQGVVEVHVDLRDDSPSEAKAVLVDDLLAEGNLLGADLTLMPEGASDCVRQTTHDVVYRWVSPREAVWTFYAETPQDDEVQTDLALSIHGLCDGQERVCVDDWGTDEWESLELFLHAGEEILIRVATPEGTDPGPFRLEAWR